MDEMPKLKELLDKLPIEDPQNQIDVVRQILDIAITSKDNGIVADTEQKIKQKTKIRVAEIRRMTADERKILKIPIEITTPIIRQSLVTVKCTDNREYELADTGIIQTEIHEKDGIQTTAEEYLWKWDSLKITMQFIQNTTRGEVDRFNFEIDGKVFQGRSIEQFQKEIYTEHHLGGTPSILGTCLSEYVKKNDIPQAQFSEICGFGAYGWCLPPAFHFDCRSGIHAEYYENIEKMMQIKVDPEQARQYMRDLYDIIGVEGKDRVFTWALYAPFAYGLKTIFHYMFFLGLLSSNPQTGKTTLAEAVTCLWWGQCAGAYDKYNFDSPSRVGKYLSGTTFPIVVDDCGDISDQSKGPIKSHATSHTKDVKQNQDQTLGINKPYQCSICFTSQDVPDLYCDTGVAERLFIEPVDLVRSPEESQAFIEVIHNIPPGYIGKYIIDRTRDFKPEYVMGLIFAMEDAPEEMEADSRTNLIYKIFQYFALLFEELFGFPLDVKDVPHMVMETRQKPNDDLFSIVTTFIKTSIGRDWEGETRYKDNLWVQSKVRERESTTGKYYVLDKNNLLDIAKKMGEHKLTMTSVHARLRTRWLGCLYKDIHVGQSIFKAIFIPKRCIEE